MLAALFFLCESDLLLHGGFSICDLLGLLKLTLALLVLLLLVEALQLFHVGVVDDLGDVELAHNFLLLLLEGFLDQLMVTVLDASLLVDLLDCRQTEMSVI